MLLKNKIKLTQIISNYIKKQEAKDTIVNIIQDNQKLYNKAIEHGYTHEELIDELKKFNT